MLFETRASLRYSSEGLFPVQPIPKSTVIFAKTPILTVQRPEGPLMEAELFDPHNDLYAPFHERIRDTFDYNEHCCLYTLTFFVMSKNGGCLFLSTLTFSVVCIL